MARGLLFASLAALAFLQGCLAAPQTAGKHWWYPSRDLDGNLYYPSERLGKSIATGDDLINDMHFYLWTASNPSDYDLLSQTDSSVLSSSNFNSNNPTIIFAHGFTEDGLVTYAQEMRDSYLAISDHNVISVDWGAGATSPEYFTAAKNTVTVGEQVALLVDLLVDNGLSLSNLHLIGFSLGAQVMGVAGNRMTSGKAARVTGLDPAHPGFNLDGDDDILDPSDGEFVDVIHTNSGDLLSGGLSFYTTCGDVDFYPNGGESQPGCLSGIKGLIIDGSCSHSRAPQLFVESIGSTSAFESCACDSYDDYKRDKCDCTSEIQMGDPCPTSATGTYYLKTHRSSPFSES